MSDTSQSLIEMIDIKEVSVMVGVSSQTIRRWKKKNIFPAPHEYSPVTLRWSKSEVLEWIEQHQPKGN